MQAFPKQKVMGLSFGLVIKSTLLKVYFRRSKNSKDPPQMK